MAGKSDELDESVPVAEEAANYTLTMSVSQVEGDFYAKKVQEYTRLTIRFPSAEFAAGMEKQMREHSDLSPKCLSSKGRQVSIVLLHSVKKFRADANGVSVVFNQKEEAKRWNGYSRIWQMGEADNELRITYNWTHKDLEKVVLPAKTKGQKHK